MGIRDERIRSRKRGGEMGEGGRGKGGKRREARRRREGEMGVDPTKFGKKSMPLFIGL